MNIRKLCPQPISNAFSAAKRSQFRVVSFMSDKAGSGAFAETQSKLHVGHRVDEGFVEVFSGFYEMCLPKDGVAVFGRINFHGFKFQL